MNSSVENDRMLEEMCRNVKRVLIKPSLGFRKDFVDVTIRMMDRTILSINPSTVVNDRRQNNVNNDNNDNNDDNGLSSIPTVVSGVAHVTKYNVDPILMAKIMGSSIVKSLQDGGYNYNTIRLVIFDKLQRTGFDFASVNELINAIDNYESARMRKLFS